MTFLVQGFAVISGAQVHRRRTGARTKPWSRARPLTGYTRPVTVNQSYVPRFPDTQPRRSLPPARIARRDDEWPEGDVPLSAEHSAPHPADLGRIDRRQLLSRPAPVRGRGWG